MPGQHNVLNAIAAIAVARELGIDDDASARRSPSFGGVKRRFTAYRRAGTASRSSTTTAIIRWRSPRCCAAARATPRAR